MVGAEARRELCLRETCRASDGADSGEPPGGSRGCALRGPEKAAVLHTVGFEYPATSVYRRRRRRSALIFYRLYHVPPCGRKGDERNSDCGMGGGLEAKRTLQADSNRLLNGDAA
eukprot:6052319-Prymnesium_polylepis.1